VSPRLAAIGIAIFAAVILRHLAERFL